MDIKIGYLLLLLALTTACGTLERGNRPWKEPESSVDAEPKAEEPKESTEEVRGEDVISEWQEFLELAHNDWKGVPYLLGGTGYQGIDCSAFMQVVFEDYFSRNIPRSTRNQLSAGRAIDKRELRTGDMVFFKTGRRTFHVGVMINRRKFLHASTTSGVTTSDLQQDFWQETYFTSRRLLTLD